MARQGDTSFPSEAGFHCHCGCAPAPPNPSGARAVQKGARCRGYLLGQTKAVTLAGLGAAARGRHLRVSRWAQLLQCCTCCSCKRHITALAQGNPKICNQQMVPCPTPLFSLSLPLSLLHRPWGCWLVRLEWTGHHFDVIFLESKQHLTLFLSWWAARKVSCPATFLVVETIAVRHCNMLKLTSNSLCVLLQMNRQKTSWAERGALLHQSLDFSLSSKQRIQTPTMSSLLQTKNIYNLSKPGSGRAIQTVSSTS